MKYFVKAIPDTDNPDCLETLRAMGLPEEPQRFAIVDPYLVHDVNKGLMKELTDDSGKGEKKWVERVKNACIDSGVCEGEQHWKEMLEFVQYHITVLAMRSNSQLSLKHDTVRGAGTLKVLAVPVSSRYEEWYMDKKGAYTVDPKVRMDPTKQGVDGIECKKGTPEASAETRRKNTTYYFTNTYSRSGDVFYDADG